MTREGRLIILLLCLQVQSHILAENHAYNPTVTVPLGRISGSVGYTVNSKPFLQFEGIPYARPPIGELRYEEPQSAEPWPGTLNATTLTSCIQYFQYERDSEGNYLIQGDEDCLYLNIYTHSTDPKANMDVLVYIHGGAFMFSYGGAFGPKILLDRPIVFVNFNYRLGPLGFLSTEDEVLPGNLGLRDQVKALNWIKNNIQYFGGNPDSITLDGGSAGAASVHLHYLIPHSRGLFKSGISRSGCALNPWVLMEDAGEKSKKLAALVGCNSDDSKELKQCLKTKPAKAIMDTVKEFQPFLYNPFSPFAPVVDGYWSNNSLIPDHPYKLLKQGKVQDLPWLASYTSAEGLYPADDVTDFWANETVLDEIDSKWNEILPFILHYNETIGGDLKNVVSGRSRQKYLGNETLSRKTFSKFVDLVGDRIFVADLDLAVKLQNAVVTSNIYSYKYDYRGAVSMTIGATGTNENLGVSHADDVIYIYSFEDLNTTSTSSDRRISELLLDMTTSFMKFQVPNITTKWRPFFKLGNKSPFVQLLISGPQDLELQSKQEVGQATFWHSLGFRENRNIR